MKRSAKTLEKFMILIKRMQKVKHPMMNLTKEMQSKKSNKSWLINGMCLKEDST
jgi:hypothetical protein